MKHFCSALVGSLLLLLCFPLLAKADPVYALYGLKGVGAEEMPPVDSPLMDGAIAYHNRKGPHAILPYDWEQFLRFADRYFKPSRRQ